MSRWVAFSNCDLTVWAYRFPVPRLPEPRFRRVTHGSPHPLYCDCTVSTCGRWPKASTKGYQICSSALSRMAGPPNGPSWVPTTIPKLLITDIHCQSGPLVEALPHRSDQFPVARRGHSMTYCHASKRIRKTSPLFLTATRNTFGYPQKLLWIF